MSETTKQRIEREIKEQMMAMRPEVDDISVKFEKLRDEYHKRCDEVVVLRDRIAQIEANATENSMNADSWAKDLEKNARERKALEEQLAASRANEQKAREERDVALVRLARIKKYAEDRCTDVVREHLVRLIGPDPLTPQKGPAATRST